MLIIIVGKFANFLFEFKFKVFRSYLSFDEILVKGVFYGQVYPVYKDLTPYMNHTIS